MTPRDAVDVLVTLLAATSGATITFAVLWLRTRRRLSRLTMERRGADDNDRLTRIEHAVDSVALEVERIGEIERFAAQVLAERADRVDNIRTQRLEPVITPH